MIPWKSPDDYIGTDFGGTRCGEVFFAPLHLTGFPINQKFYHRSIRDTVSLKDGNPLRKYELWIQKGNRKGARHMIVNLSRYFFPAPAGCRSVLKKRAAAWFTMRSWGLGYTPTSDRWQLLAIGTLLADYQTWYRKALLADYQEWYQKAPLALFEIGYCPW